MLFTIVPAGRAGPDDVRPSVIPSKPERPGEARALTFYVPNRLLDLTDIVRFRVKAGPGLSAGVRATDYLSFYAGRHRAGYVGLPGPRYPERWLRPYGWEQDRGFIFFGVDATDTFEDAPQYGYSEIDAGLHLLFLGLEIGIDPVEIGDFLAGIVMIDIQGDDLEIPRPADAAVRYERGSPLFQADRPHRFDDLGQRLEFVRTNFTAGLGRGAGRFDAVFAEGDIDPPEHVPQSRLWLGVFGELEVDDGASFTVDPDFTWEVDLPNLERRWSVFVNSMDSDELPGVDPEDREGSLFIGVDRDAGDFDIDSSAGIKTKWVPELFGRLEWKRPIDTRRGSVVPRIRAFWESDDGFGLLSVIKCRKWLGNTDRTLFYTTTGGTWSEERDGLMIEQTVGFARLLHMIENPDTIRDVKREDVGKGWGIRWSTFAFSDSDRTEITRHRITLGHRRPLYRDWIHLDVGPELEWSNDDDWDTIPRIRIGVETLFWGIGQE